MKNKLQKAFDKFNKLDHRAQSYLRAGAVQTLIKEGKEPSKENIDDKLFTRWLENGESWSQKSLDIL